MLLYLFFLLFYHSDLSSRNTPIIYYHVIKNITDPGVIYISGICDILGDRMGGKKPENRRVVILNITDTNNLKIKPGGSLLFSIQKVLEIF